jgi:hypothetical protein
MMNQTASQLGEKFDDTLEQAEKLGRKARQALDDARHRTANTLSDSASSVRDAAQQFDGLAGRTAATLDSTASYIHDHDSRGMLADLQEIIWGHPTTLAVGAAAAGFLIGLSVRRFGSSRSTTGHSLNPNNQDQ